jgi:hypothetical protein
MNDCLALAIKQLSLPLVVWTFIGFVTAGVATAHTYDLCVAFDRKSD